MCERERGETETERDPETETETESKRRNDRERQREKERRHIPKKHSKETCKTKQSLHSHHPFLRTQRQFQTHAPAEGRFSEP